MIELQEINKSYSNGNVITPVLYDINLTFYKKDFTAIIGGSGSGKSTLLNLISTLDVPSSGTIAYNHEDISTFKKNKLADFRFENIGLVFQHFHLLPTLTAIENVMSPFFGRKTKVDYKQRAAKLLEQMGLQNKLSALPSHLSGGEQQRVAIARSLINQPEWLLADEPTGNLDSRNSENFYNILLDLKERLGCGIIVVTHDSKLAEKADRMIEIKDGCVQASSVPSYGAARC